MSTMSSAELFGVGLQRYLGSPAILMIHGGKLTPKSPF